MTSGEWEPSANSAALAAAVAVVVLAAAVAPAVGGAAVASAAEESAASIGTAPMQTAPTDNETGANGTADGAANGTTVYHRNPDEVGGGPSEAEVWLANEMADRLSRSVNLSQSERRRAENLVSNDSEYAELAQQYRAATDGSEGERAATFSAIGLAQRDLLATVGTYRTVHQRYQEVRRGDNRTRERLLAHELGRLARDVNRSAAGLVGMYENVSSNSSVDLRNTPDQIRDLRANISRTQQRVRKQTLVGTRLRITPVRTNGSFTRPLTFEVRLTTADGDPIADRNVTIEVGNESVEATTNRRGRFTLDYRPVEARTGTRTRTLRYNPANSSRYASAAQRINLSVHQIEPNVRVTDRPDRVGYGEEFVVEGRVGADGVGAAVPLNVSVGDVKLTTTESADNGSFRATADLPANVTAGDRQLRVGVNLTGKALSGTATTVPVTVERTPTNVSITETRQREDTVFVTGRLTTAGGEGLENKTVELRVGDATVEATTNATGGYGTSATVPRRLRDGSSVAVRAAYADDESNLGASRAEASVAVTVADSGLPVRETLLRLAGIVGVSVVGALLVRRYRPDRWPSLGDGADGEETASAAESDDEAAPAADPEVEAEFETALDAARDELDAGARDAAVVAAYDAVRARLGESVGDRSAATHWEFYADCRDGGLADERLDQLERLTTRYERAAFAAETVPRETAEEAVDLAASFRPDGDEAGRDGDADDGAGDSASRNADSTDASADADADESADTEDDATGVADRSGGLAVGED